MKSFEDYQYFVSEGYGKPEDDKHGRQLVAALGLCGEAGEVADRIKKIIYNKGEVSWDVHRGQLVEELGDVLWYVTFVCNIYDISLEEVIENNMIKTFIRYEKFYPKNIFYDYATDTVKIDRRDK